MLDIVGTATGSTIGNVTVSLENVADSLTGLLTGVSGILTQTISQLTGTLSTILSTVTDVHIQLISSIVTLNIVVREAACEKSEPFSNVTSTLTTASAVYTQAATQVTPDSVRTSDGLAFIIQIVDNIFGVVTGTVTQITPVLGSDDVQSALNVLLQANKELIDAGYILYNSPTRGCVILNSFTVALAAYFSAAFKFVKSVHAIAASVAANVSSASDDVIEAINALVVIFATALQAVLIGLDKTAEIIHGLPKATLQILTVAIHGVHAAVKRATVLVSQTSSILSGSSSAASGLTENVKNIASSLAKIVVSLSEHWHIISRVL